MIEVEAPDGTIIEFPDDMPEPDIQMAMRRLYPPPSALPTEESAPVQSVGPPPVEPYLPPLREPTERTFANQMGTGLQASLHGLANLLGLPGDFGAAAGNAGLYAAEKATDAVLPGDQDSYFGRFKGFGGSGPLRDLVDQGLAVAQIPTIPAEEKTFGENLVGSGITFGTEAAAGAGGLARIASARAAALDAMPAINRLPIRADSLLQHYAPEAIARQFTAEAAGGFGAGAGMETARQTLPEPLQGPVSDIVGALIGGTGATTAVDVARAPGAARRALEQSGPALDVPMSEITQGGRTVARLPYSRREVGLARDFLAERAGGDLGDIASVFADQIAEYRHAGDPLPTTDRLIRDIGLSSTLGSRRVGEAAPDFMKRDQQVQRAAEDRLRGIGPEKADTRAPQKLAEAEAAKQMQAVEGATEQARAQVAGTEKALEGAQQEAIGLAAPVKAERGGEAAASKALDETVTTTLERDTAKKNALFDAVDPKNAVAVDAAPILSLSRAIRQSANKLAPTRQQLPQEFLDRIDKLAPDIVEETTGLLDAAGKPLKKEVNIDGEGTVQIKDLMELRPYLRTAETKARTAGEFNLAGNVGDLRKAVNDEIDTFARSGDEAAAQAQAYYRDYYAPLWREGTGKKFKDAIDRDDLARTGTPPTKTAETFILANGGGAEEAAKDLRRIIDAAPSPEDGAQAVRKYMIARLANAVGDGDKIAPKTLRKWRENHSDVLAQFPAVRDEVDGLLKTVVANDTRTNQLRDDLRAFTTELKAAEKTQAATTRRIEQGILGTLINSDPQKAVRAVFGGKDPTKAMDETLALIKDSPDAMEGWRRAVADEMLDRVSGSNTGLRAAEADDYRGAITAAKLVGEFKKNEALYEKVFTPAEMNAARRAHKLLESFQTGGRRATSGSDTVEKMHAAKTEWVRNALETVLKLHFGQLRGGGYYRSSKLLARNLPKATLGADELLTRAALDPEFALILMQQPGSPPSALPRSTWLRNRILLQQIVTDENDEPVIDDLSE